MCFVQLRPNYAKLLSTSTDEYAAVGTGKPTVHKPLQHQNLRLLGFRVQDEVSAVRCRLCLTLPILCLRPHVFGKSLRRFLWRLHRILVNSRSEKPEIGTIMAEKARCMSFGRSHSVLSVLRKHWDGTSRGSEWENEVVLVGHPLIKPNLTNVVDLTRPKLSFLATCVTPLCLSVNGLSPFLVL